MHSLRRIVSSSSCRLVGLAAAASASLFAADPSVHSVASVTAVVRDNHLFVGVDPFLRRDRELLAVRKFAGADTVLLRATGEELTVPQSNGYQLQLRPKVSPIAVRIEGLAGQAVFSPWTDPTGQWMNRQMALAGQYGDQMDAANRELGQAMARIAQAETLENTSGPLPAEQSSQGIAAQAAVDYQTRVSQVKMLNDPEITAPRRNALGEKKGAQDTIELQFKLSAPQPIADAHVLALVRIRTDADGFRDVSFQRAVGAIGPDERSFRLTQDGLPPGFDFVSAQLHVFNQTAEIATNLSERHLPLTAAEAREYARLDHLAQNRGATLPAQPVWSLAPDALRSAGNPAAFDFEVEVEVDAQGQLVALRPGRDQILPASVRLLLEQMPYLPALEAGKPVGATVAVNLADYFR